MVSRNDIFTIADQIEMNDESWKDDILKYFSTDELKDFFDDYARLRSFGINWNTLNIFDEEYE